MTQPTLICLKRDLPAGIPKIFLRTLLYTTATKGRVVENVFLRVHNEYGDYLFDFWGHTESSKLTLGSGLFVGSAGVAADHHFNPRRDANRFVFASGKYRVEIFATVVGRAVPKKLKEVSFTVDGQEAMELIQIADRQLYLFWDADQQNYDRQLQRGPGVPLPPSWGVVHTSGGIGPADHPF